MADLYTPGELTLKAAQKPDFDHGRFDTAARYVYNSGGFTPDMLGSKPVRALIDETNRVLGSSITVSHETPPELTAALRNNVFIFSGLKTYHSLSEVGLSLTNEDGSTKSWPDFYNEVKAIDGQYNGNYLYAEYNHAVHSAQMAVKWHEWEKDGDQYDLQYRTAGDERVREAHHQLDGVTLPPSDKFWERYLPPNGWNCRCNVVQVLRDDYPRSDSDKATAIGDEYTRPPKAQMFRFNAGKTLEIFPAKHPYRKAPEKVKKAVEQMAVELRTPQEVVDFLNASEERRAWFERGFNSLIPTTKRGVNGYTNMRGLIAMTKARLDNVLAGLTKLRQGKEITFDEADALATFWHEITHNRSKPGYTYMTKLQTQYMELANEFVARKTLPEFYESVGGKMQYPEFMDDRQSTGYNNMVRNYCNLITKTKAEPAAVLERVKKHLFEEPYDNQSEGLVKALQEHGAQKPDGSKMKLSEIKKAVKLCVEYDYSEKLFDKNLQTLLVTE